MIPKGGTLTSITDNELSKNKDKFSGENSIK